MTSATLFTACLMASANLQGAASLSLGAPTRTQDAVEFILQAPAEALVRAEIHVKGARVTVFVPGVMATPRVSSFPEGPVKRLQIVAKQRGTPVIVTLRYPKHAHKRVRLLPGNPWKLRVAAPSGASGATRARTQIAASSTAQSDAVAPTLVAATSATSPTSLFTTRPDASASPLSLSLLIGMLLLALATAAWAWRRHQRGGAHDAPQSIEVLATRPFGGKHRLALVETCGERLLLATSDKEVQVLSHLGVSEVSGAQELMDAPAEESEGAERGSADIAGIIKLRAHDSDTRRLRGLGSSTLGVTA